jgi:hypothetical protein
MDTSVFAFIAGLLIYPCLRALLRSKRSLSHPRANKVPCSQWALWYGREIEGSQDRGQYTLFVRRLEPPHTLRDFKDRFSRIWFCAEYRNWTMIRLATECFKDVCVEVKYGEQIPQDIFRKVRVYLKIPDQIGLKRGDQLCFGSAYCDEAFEIGKGIKVSPEEYMQDIRIA